MPPKQAPNKKSQEKLKNKIIEDKTFGLKNKKGAKQQKFIEQVQKQVQNKMVNKNPRDMPEDKTAKKEEEKKKKEEIAQLFKPVMQTIPKGVDPKSVVCVYFKQNLCQKGDKCKFSHDLNIERKAEKRNIYEDTREQDTMENWDEEKLEDVVNRKHGEDNVKKIQTQIVCKYFIEAVENKTYGWFWACPNGETCIYRHALPPGFTLKSDSKKKEDEEEISLEMLVEKERASLGPKVTKVTLESFLAWKARKIQEKKDDRRKQDDKKLKDFKLGFMNGLTGRDIFTFNPDLITNDDDEAENDIDYRRREYDEGEEGELPAEMQSSIRDISTDFLASQATEVDGSGTLATDDRFSYIQTLLDKENQRQKEKQEAAAAAAAEAENNAEEEEEEDDDEEQEEEGDGDDDDEGEDDEDEDEEKSKESLKKLVTSSDNNKNNKKSSKLKNGDIEIDESLFNLEDLQDLDEELDKLDI